MSGQGNSFKNKLIINAGDMSGDLTSSIIPIQYIDNLGTQLNIISGTPTGSLTLQVSYDHSEDGFGNVTTAGNWFVKGTQAITGGAPTPAVLEISNSPAAYARLVYTHTSGTGTGSAYASGKKI